MGTVYELEAEVKPNDVDKRQTLTSRIDLALCLSGARVTAGRYRVVIERVPEERPARKREAVHLSTGNEYLGAFRTQKDAFQEVARRHGYTKLDDLRRRFQRFPKGQPKGLSLQGTVGRREAAVTYFIGTLAALQASSSSFAVPPTDSA